MRHSIKWSVVAECCIQFSADWGLIGIKVSRVEVHNHTLAVIFLKFAESPVSIGKWEYPQVAPTRTGEILAQKTYGGRRELKQRMAVLQPMCVRESSRPRHPI